MPIGGEIPAAPGAGLEKLLEGSGDLLTDLGGHRQVAQGILGRTEKGEGFLGAITSESQESKELGNSFNDALHSLNAILKKIDSGKGLVGKLLVDEKYGNETATRWPEPSAPSSPWLAKIDEGVRTGEGAIPALLSDPEGKKKVYALVDDLATAAATLAAVAQNLQKGDGAIPILLNDPQFGKQFTQNLQSFSERLDSIAAQARRRPGHGRHADQRPLRLRRRAQPRHRRQRVGDPELAPQGPPEGGHQEAVQRRRSESAAHASRCRRPTRT